MISVHLALTVDKHWPTLAVDPQRDALIGQNHEDAALWHTARVARRHLDAGLATVSKEGGDAGRTAAATHTSPFFRPVGSDALTPAAPPCTFCTAAAPALAMASAASLAPMRGALPLRHELT